MEKILVGRPSTIPPLKLSRRLSVGVSPKVVKSGEDPSEWLGERMRPACVVRRLAEPISPASRRGTTPGPGVIPYSNRVRILGKRSFSAMSLLQILVVMAIVGMLAVLAIPAYQEFTRRAAKAVCINNLKQLHLAFSSYLQDVGYWPQMPESVSGNEKSYEEWWIKTMEPYGATPKLWICPVLKNGQIKDEAGNPILMHYIPTQFDANRISPTRWPGQPWLIERGDAHGGGSLIIFPDGSVKGLTEVLQGG